MCAGKEIHLAGRTEEETALWIRRMRSAARYGKVFGVALEEHLDAAGRRGQLPVVVEQCIELLRAKGLGLEGVLRVGGSKKRMEEYKLAFDMLGEAALGNETDMHTVAGLLKMYLRELPLPLIPQALYPRLLQAVSASPAGGGRATEEDALLSQEQIQALAEGIRLSRVATGCRRVATSC